MEIDFQIRERMRDLAIDYRATLLSSYTRFDNGEIDEPHINFDIQTLTAFIDATGSELPDDFCPQCLCYNSSHNWKCPNDSRRG